MNGKLVSELLVALIKLAGLQMRLGTIAAEVAWANGRTCDQLDAGADQPISEEQIGAAARAIELKLIGGHELGFQCLLRANFSDVRIREMAKAALEAAALSNE